jgi:tetratricopeptide (TPR) repeat protein
MDLDKYLEEITKSKAIQLLAAGTENQPVSDSGLRVGNSAFTGALLDILESESELEVDGILTADEVGLKLRTEVMRHYNDRQSDQTPVSHHLMGSKAGDFVLRISKKLRATIDNKSQQRDEKGTSLIGNNNTVDTGPLIFTVHRHLQQREYEEALRSLDEALKANPRAPYIWFLKGNVLSLKRDYGEAVACYDRVLELTPDDQLAQKYRKQAMRNLDKARNPKKKTAKGSGEVKKLPRPRQKSAEVSTKLSDEIDQKIAKVKKILPYTTLINRRCQWDGNGNTSLAIVPSTQVLILDILNQHCLQIGMKIGMTAVMLAMSMRCMKTENERTDTGVNFRKRYNI